MRRRAGFILHACAADDLEAFQKRLVSAVDAGNGVKCLRIFGIAFDVKTDPIDETDAILEVARIGARGVQSHRVALVLYQTHGRGQRRVHTGLTSREHDAVEQSLALFQKRLDGGPGGITLFAAARAHPAVMTVRATPRTAAQKNNCREFAGKINAGKRRYRRDAKRRGGSKNVEIEHLSDQRK